MADYIEREAAVKELMHDAPEQVGYSREDAADCIRYIPAADVAPVVHGRWGYNSNAGTYQCPNCLSVVHERHEVFDLEANDGADLNFCPNCGARMDLEVSNGKSKNDRLFQASNAE